jgi:hypothetical protein
MCDSPAGGLSLQRICFLAHAEVLSRFPISPAEVVELSDLYSVRFAAGAKTLNLHLTLNHGTSGSALKSGVRNKVCQLGSPLRRYEYICILPCHRSATKPAYGVGSGVPRRGVGKIQPKLWGFLHRRRHRVLPSTNSEGESKTRTGNLHEICSPSTGWTTLLRSDLRSLFDQRPDS